VFVLIRLATYKSSGTPRYTLLPISMVDMFL